jgi:hypothetical protein
VPQRPVRPSAFLFVLAFSTCLLVLPLRAPAAQEQDPRPLPDLTGIVKDPGWARILGKALFWDTVASANGSDCASCHFVTGANRHIRDQSAAPLQLLRAAIDGPAPGSPLPALSVDDSSATARPHDDANGIVDVCARHVHARSVELPDFGPVRTSVRVAAEDPSCHEDLTVRLARSLLERKPLEDRSINPQDGTFGPDGPHGNIVSPTGQGLERTYQWMIEQAFEEPLWKGPDNATASQASSTTPVAGPGTKVEQNFALFWGVALMVYESTLDPHWARDHEVARSSSIPASTRRAEWE